MNPRLETSGAKGEITALTGIRAIAAFWVLGYHFYRSIGILFPVAGGLLTTLFKPGQLGVDLFFLLSGFIIAYNYQDKLHPFRLNSYKEFLWARLARLYPVHLATLLGCLLLFLAAKLAGAHLNTAATNWGAVAFVANLFMVHAWSFHAHYSWNFPSWSISCEWLAYICFPILAAVVSSKWNRPVLWAFVALLLIGQLGLTIMEWEVMRWPFASILFEFPAGVVLWRIYTRRTPQAGRFGNWWQLLIMAGLGGTLISCQMCGIPTAVLIPVLALLLYSLAANANGIASRFCASKILCYWGRVSYSLYMTHAVTSMVLVRFMPLPSFEGRPLTVRLLVSASYIVLLGVVAMLTYHFVEEPFRRQMRHIFPSASAKTPAFV